MNEQQIISRLLDESEKPDCHHTLKGIAEFYQRTGHITKPQLNLCEKLMPKAEGDTVSPAEVFAKVSNRIVLKDLPLSLDEKLRDALTFANPKYQDAVRMNRVPMGIPKYLAAYQTDGDSLSIPRGLQPELEQMCRDLGFALTLEDYTLDGEVRYKFKGELRPYQEEAVEEILSRDIGVLCAPTGSGKTVIALAVIAERKQPTLIIVHTKELLYQWIDRIETFLGIPKDEVGKIGDGCWDVGRQVTVGIVNSVYKVKEEIKEDFGFVISDESQRCPSRQFSEAVSTFPASFLLGLSATPYRRDRLTRLIFWYLGPLVHEIPLEALQEEGSVLKARVEWRYTDFRSDYDPVEEYPQMLSELTNEPERNKQIAQDVMSEKGGGIRLVLTDRKNHVDALKALLYLEGDTPNVETLTGSTPKQEREATIRRLKKAKSGVLIATGQLIGEGFDLPILTSLFLATPISFDGRVIQYLGRILRPAEGKGEPVVYDYCDRNVSVLLKSAKARNRVYKKHGLKTVKGLEV